MTAAGTVVDTLLRMRGVWHDRVCAYHPDGRPMDHDEHGSVAGPTPYENLVYIDFDGTHLRQTNVTFHGRPTRVRTFDAEIRDGVLRFAQLGPGDPGHIGVGVGTGRVVFCAARNDHPGTARYDEPDVVELTAPDRRRRTTILYRDGALVRTLEVTGTRIAATADHRLAIDPRGPDGPVHEDTSVTHAFTGASDD